MKRPPLTRDLLLSARAAYQGFIGDDDDWGALDRWSDFTSEYGAELIALALAGLDGRQSHDLLLDLLARGPLTVQEMRASTGQTYSQLYGALLTLEKRERVTRWYDTIRARQIWALPEHNENATRVG